jgi:hypothetical protein
MRIRALVCPLKSRGPVEERLTILGVQQARLSLGPKHESVARIQVLVVHQDLVNVITVCRPTRELIPQNLKDVLQAVRVIDVDIRYPVRAVCENDSCKLP